MRRRDFVVLAGAAAAWPRPVFAQATARRPRVGVMIYSNPKQDPNTQAFLRALHELGYVDGVNISIDYRFAEGHPERLPGLAAELVKSQPDLIFVLGGDVASHVGKATQKIPIVYAISSDPVSSGLAASLARPGGNATGVTFLQDELASKRLEVLKEAAPRTSRVAFLWNPDHSDNELPVARRAAERLGVEVQSLEIHKSGNFDDAFSASLRASADSVYVVSSRQMVANVRRIVGFANDNRLPLAGGWGAWAQAGGLVSYGPDVSDMVRQATQYVDRIIKGAKPGDLPVQQPTRFELLVNLKTAKALGLSIPESFLLRADRIIE